MHQTMFIGDDVALDVHDGGHPVSIVTFESRNKDFPAGAASEFGPGFGRGRFAPLGMNELLIRHNRNHWYQTAEIEQVAELVVAATQGTRVLTYGSSMGAYAAVNFAHLVDADQFVAISPLFDVAPGNVLDERRWAEDWPHTSFDYNLIVSGAGSESRGYVFYGEHTADRAHAEKIAGHTRATLVPLPFGGHPAGFYLNRTYGIKRLIAEIAADSFEEPSFRSVLAETTSETHYPYEREAKRLAEAGDVLGAIAQLDVAVEKSPRLARLHIARGNHLLSTQSLDEAEQAFAAAISNDPQAAEGHVRLSYVHAARRDFDAAVRSTTRAIELEPGRPELHLRRGEWLLANGDRTSALEEMERATVLRPDFTRAHDRIAVVRARSTLAHRARRVLGAIRARVVRYGRSIRRNRGR